MEPNLLQDKSYSFAKSTIRYAKSVQKKHQEFILSKQFIRSGTSIAAMVREAKFAESRNDFIHKLKIALKEANENLYWLNLISDCYECDELETNCLKKECDQLIGLLVVIIKKLKINQTLSNQKG